MREIKFRIYDDLTKQMLEVESHNFKMGLPQGCYLMQFTGLHDKNGVEIYEGDIVRWHVRAEWDEKVYREAKGDVKYEVSAFVVYEQSDRWDLREFEDLEIIGNIYENKELLKK